MTNEEKYSKELNKYFDMITCDKYQDTLSFCKNFVRPKVLKTESCREMPCGLCNLYVLKWLKEEAEEDKPELEPFVKDELIKVRDTMNDSWKLRYFAYIDHDGTIYTYTGGRSSENYANVVDWKYGEHLEADELRFFTMD